MKIMLVKAAHVAKILLVVWLNFDKTHPPTDKYYKKNCVQTFDKQDPRALDSSRFVFSNAGIAAAIFTVKIRDFQKSNILEECAFVFLISLDLFVIFVPLYGYWQGARYKTLQMSKRSFDTFRLLQFSCERWWNYLI